MTLTVTEKEHWKTRIDRKIDRKIEAICLTSPNYMPEVKRKAHEQAAQSLGIAEILAQRDAAKNNAKRCEDQARSMTRRAVAVLRGIGPDEVGGTEWSWETDIQAALNKRTALAQQEVLSKDELGRQILKLEDEKESLLDTVWLATSPRQLRDLWQDVCRLVDDAPTALQHQTLSRPAADDTTD